MGTRVGAGDLREEGGAAPVSRLHPRPGLLQHLRDSGAPSCLSLRLLPHSPQNAAVSTAARGSCLPGLPAGGLAAPAGWVQ